MAAASNSQTNKTLDQMIAEMMTAMQLIQQENQESLELLPETPTSLAALDQSTDSDATIANDDLVRTPTAAEVVAAAPSDIATTPTIITVGSVVAELKSMLSNHLKFMHEKFYAPIEKKVSDFESTFTNFQNECRLVDQRARAIFEKSRALDNRGRALTAMLNEYRCSICMVGFKDRLFACGHAFCQTCVDKTYDEPTQAGTCPLCRSKVEPALAIRLMGP